MRKDKVLHSINLCQGSMSVREYALQFTQLSNYSPTMVADSRARMSNFISSVSEMVVKEVILPHSLMIGKSLVSLFIHNKLKRRK